MPYIKQEDRNSLKGDSFRPGRLPQTSGELNYLVTELVISYLTIKDLSYQTCNDIVGALDNAKDEFKRRVQNPYEDKKIQENGDVYK